MSVPHTRGSEGGATPPSADGAVNAARYFTERPALHRLLAGCRATYERLSRVGGRAVVSEPSADELRAVRDFLGKRPKVHDGRLWLPLEELDEQLRRTRFACGLPELLSAYYGDEVRTRAEERRQVDATWHDFSGPLSDLLVQEAAHAWWRAGGSRQVLRLLRDSLHQDGGSPGPVTAALHPAVRHVLLALGTLPGESRPPELLPIFAHRVTGDPHAFDADTVAGRLLTSALSTRAAELPAAAADPLFDAGIARDDVSSQVLAAGVAPADEPLSRWPISWPLLTLLRWPSARAIGGVAYVVENPSVFRELCRLGTTEGAPLRTVICPSGQPSGAALRLVDLLVEGGAEIRYAGDFDPAGVAIAARLRERYGDRLVPWFMDAAAYLAALQKHSPNHQAQMLTQSEREQLGRLRSDLPELVAALLEHGQKLFQEALIPEMRVAITAP